MKLVAAALSLVILLSGCVQKAKEGDETEAGGNQALYDEVMKVHDEVMPKMNDIYKLKQKLKEQIAKSPDLVDEKRKAIESTILKLDSASEGMMVWMRNFNPLPDSLGEDKAREYLKDQQQKIIKVKEQMLKAIEEGERISSAKGDK